MFTKFFRAYYFYSPRVNFLAYYIYGSSFSTHRESKFCCVGNIFQSQKRIYIQCSVLQYSVSHVVCTFCDSFLFFSVTFHLFLLSFAMYENLLIHNYFYFELKFNLLLFGQFIRKRLCKKKAYYFCSPRVIVLAHLAHYVWLQVIVFLHTA